MPVVSGAHTSAPAPKAAAQEKLAAATAWCEEQGVDSVGMLRDDVDEEDREAFVACLQLKPLKVKQLLKKLKGDA